MKMVPLNILIYLYCMLSSLFSKKKKQEKQKVIDKRAELKKLRKKLKQHYKEDKKHVR
jgi:LytS/YehU family sensor histidine kinase